MQIKGIAVIDTEAYDILPKAENGNRLFINAFSVDNKLTPIHNIVNGISYPKFFVVKRGNANRIADEFIKALKQKGVFVSEVNGSVYSYSGINQTIGQPKEILITNALKLFKEDTRMKAASIITAVLLILVVGLAGCGDDQRAKKQLPKALQACELLTRAQLEAVIGEVFGETGPETHQEQEDYWMSSCSYYSEVKSIRAGLLIRPNLGQGGAEGLALLEAKLKETFGQAYKLEPVEGVGESAGWEASGKQLTIFQGPYILILSAAGPTITDGESLELSKKLFDTVLAKLPD